MEVVVCVAKGDWRTAEECREGAASLRDSEPSEAIRFAVFVGTVHRDCPEAGEGTRWVEGNCCV